MVPIVVPKTAVFPTDTIATIANKTSVPQWIAALEAHGVPNAQEIVDWYVKEGQRLRIDHNIAIAQAVHETGWFQSRRWLEENNPAGLGVVSDDAVVAPFDSVQDGITAHLEHLCSYAYTIFDCPADHMHLQDRRHFFHDGKPLLKDLIRPNVRSWAVPGTGYIDAITRIATQVLGGPMPSATPSRDDIGYPVRVHLAADTGPTRNIKDVHWFVVHDTEGGLAGSEAVLTGSGDPVASAHAIIDRDGSLVFSVPVTTTAWTAGNDLLSEQAIQVELVGFASGGYTEEQYRSLSKFYQWCTSQGMQVPAVYIGKQDADGGPLPDYDGIIGHQDVPDGAGGWGGSSHHTDPGPHFDWNKLISYIGGTPPATPAPTPAPADPLDLMDKSGLFWARWNHLNELEENLALVTYGYPILPERFYNGRWMQRFERAAMATGDGENPWDVVTLDPKEWPPEW